MYFDSRFDLSSFCPPPALREPLDSHHRLEGLPRDNSSSGTVLMFMLGIGESTGWYAFQNPLSLAPTSEGDSDSVLGVKFDRETGLVPMAEESIESFRLTFSSSGAVESLVKVVGLGW